MDFKTPDVNQQRSHYWVNKRIKCVVSMRALWKMMDWEQDKETTADLTRQAHGTLGHTSPRLVREVSLLTLPRDLGLASLMTVVATLCALHSCKYGQDTELNWRSKGEGLKRNLYRWEKELLNCWKYCLNWKFVEINRKNVQVYGKIGYKYQPFWGLNFSRAAILYFMT